MARQDCDLIMIVVLQWSRVPHGPLQLMVETSGLVVCFLPYLLPECGYGFSEFQGTKQDIVVMAIDDGVTFRKQKLLADARGSLFFEFLACLAQEV